MPGKCPNYGVNSCDGRFVTKDIHKTIEKVLHSKKFYCKNEFCPHRKYDYFNNKYQNPKSENVELSYLEALKHLYDCPYKHVKCSLGCGRNIQAS